MAESKPNRGWTGSVALVVMLVGGVMGGGAAVAATDADRLAERRAALTDADVAQRVALGRWAEERGLVVEAMQLYCEALLRDGDQRTAYERWVKLAKEHEPPVDRDRRASLQQTFSGMKLHATSHFLIFYDTEEGWARNRAALLEKAHDVYYETFRRMDFKPWPLSERLVCVLYEDHDDYIAYGRKHDGVDMGWAAGYYSGRTNRIVFFDDRNGPQFEALAERVNELEARQSQARDRLEEAVRTQAHGSAIELREYLRDVGKALRWYENRKEAIAKMGNASKTVHEAVHQLAFNSRLQLRTHQYPFWFSEGMATNFETDQPFKDFGPFHSNLPRQRGFQDMVRDDRLIPLRELVGATSANAADREVMLDQYNQSWALFRFLFRHKRDELRKFLAGIAAGKPGPRSEEQLRRAFVEAFGPLDRLDKQLEAYARRVR